MIEKRKKGKRTGEVEKKGAEEGEKRLGRGRLRVTQREKEGMRKRGTLYRGWAGPTFPMDHKLGIHVISLYSFRFPSPFTLT